VQLQWTNHWGALSMIKHMALLELVPVVLALSVWAQLLQNKRILFHESILPNNKVSYILGQQEDHQISLEMRERRE
jgi:hypothetical protein